MMVLIASLSLRNSTLSVELASASTRKSAIGEIRAVVIQDGFAAKVVLAGVGQGSGGIQGCEALFQGQCLRLGVDAYLNLAQAFLIQIITQQSDTVGVCLRDGCGERNCFRLSTGSPRRRSGGTAG